MSTSEENDLLQHVGFVLLDNFCTATTCTLLYGVFVFLFYMSSASLLCMTRTGTSFNAGSALVHSDQLRSGDNPLGWDYRGPSDTNPLRVVTTWASGILPIISDIVVIWRAWTIFFQNRRWVMIGPLVLLLGTIATTLAYLILFLRIKDRPTMGEGAHNLLNLLSAVSIGLSLGSNASATLAIGFALWQVSVPVRYGSTPHIPTSAGAIKAYLLTSSLRIGSASLRKTFFSSWSSREYCTCVLQLITLILILYPPQAVPPGSAADIAGTVFYAAYYLVSAMYPTIVVVLVNQQRSFVDTCGFTNVELNSDLTQKYNSSAPLAPVWRQSSAVPSTKVLGPLESQETGVDSKNS
ncbi:hypothetical protein Hypma_007122 [Hypsizygus marmoreus]|uniref:Uncharacterized protein n=1 Tax=Hypsizygus marmoreus TaxID=39966 RepID=A0A369KA76_HYPMA|nr:hypothetical protein Hypma_007122 [Hypsizygus marmoreus]